MAEHHAGASLEDMIAKRRDELGDLLARADAVHALGHVIMSESFTSPDTYRESEHPGLAYVIELVAAELIRRPGRHGSTANTPALDAPVAPVLWQLAGTRVMPPGVTIPWVVMLYELEHVCATIEWPAQFVHFLRRRARLNARGGLSATDELDWWMHYLSRGLYFEGEGEIRLASHTDPLDAWVLFDKGIRERPAPKPQMMLDKSTRSALDYLDRERPGGWVAATCTLLEPAGEVRRKLWKDVQKLRRQARERQKVQRMTLFFEETTEPMLICSVVVPDSNSQFLLEHLENCVAERVEEHGPQRVLGLGHIVCSCAPTTRSSCSRRPGGMSEGLALAWARYTRPLGQEGWAAHLRTS